VDTSDRLWIASPSSPDRPGQYGQQQLDQAGNAQADRADRYSTIGLPPVARVVPCAGQREGCSRITQP